MDNEDQFPPLSGDWEEVSGVHARFSESGTLLQIQFSGDGHRIRKLIRGAWKALTWKEKAKIIVSIKGFAVSVFSAGLFWHHIWAALKVLVEHGR